VAVYLMQHGIPVSKAEDPERPLSAKGMKDIENLAEFLQKRRITLKMFITAEKGEPRRQRKL